MITNLKPYPAYKDSGVEWLGQVPEHWEVRRLRSIAEMRVSNVDKHTKEDEQPVRLCNYTDVYRNERINSAMVFKRATATKDEIERFRLKRGDVLITKDSEQWNDIGIPALVDDIDEDIVCGYHLALLRPFAETATSAYLLRALQSTAVAYQFHISANGVTRYGLSHDAVKSVRLLLPPLPEQTAIVRFLDYIDRRIRRVIQARKNRIRLLEEYKQALIQQAVTGKIDVRTGQPYPAYKPSGVPWLGQVPEHWEVVPLKRIAHGRLKYGANAAAEFNNPSWPRYLRITDFRKNGELRDDTFRSLPPDVAKEYLVRPGDILLARSGATVGKSFLVAASTGIACYAGYLIRVRPNLARTRPEFLFAFLQSHAFSEWRSAAFIVATIENISAEKYGDLLLPIPTLEEQECIVEWLKQRFGKIDTAIEAARREIELLREYRTRLIADVVTGKVDVREVAARLPEELSEEEAESMDAYEIAEDETTDEEAGTETVEEEEVEP